VNVILVMVSKQSVILFYSAERHGTDRDMHSVIRQTVVLPNVMAPFLHPFFFFVRLEPAKLSLLSKTGAKEKKDIIILNSNLK
jgi:hypothetical protein